MTQGPLRGGHNGKFYDSEQVLFNDDQWHCVEAYFKLNTLDLANDRPKGDGVVRGWFDGRLEIDHTDVVLRSTDFPNMKFNHFLMAPYFGSGLLPHPQKLWIDELAVGTKRLGPLPGRRLMRPMIAAEALFSTLDVVNVSPRDDSDDLSLASSKVMQQLLQYRLTTPDAGIPWFLVAMGAYQDAQVAGVALSYHYWQYDRLRNIDRPWVELLPVENFRFDPAASWLDVVNTTPYCIRMVPMYVKDVTARMTVPDPITMQLRWKKVEASQLLSLTKQQWDSTRLARQGKGRTDQMDNPKGINEYSIVWCHQNVVEWNGIDYVYWTGGTEFVLSDPRPLQESFAHGRRPFVMGFSSVETHKPYPSGPVRQAKDVQAETSAARARRGGRPAPVVFAAECVGIIISPGRRS